MKKMLHKLWMWSAFASAFILAPLASAEDGGSNKVDLGTAVNDLQTAATDTISAVKPAVVTIVIALMAIVGIVFAWKQIRARLGR